MGRASAHITTHRPPIQLPERPETGLTQQPMAPPETGRQGLNGVTGVEADDNPLSDTTVPVSLSMKLTL
jgi:hypothetical protein